MFCKQCGTQINENTPVCLKCGTKNNAHTSTSPTDSNMSQSDQILKRGKKGIMSVALIVIVIIGLGVWGSFSDDETSINNTNSLTSIGDYNCTDYHADQADLLFTSVDYTNDIVELDALWYELENMVVDEYSQEAIDAYNIKVDTYNTKSDDLDARIIASEGSIEEHDRKIDDYNNYLDANCVSE